MEHTVAGILEEIGKFFDILPKVSPPQKSGTERFRLITLGALVDSDILNSKEKWKVIVEIYRHITELSRIYQKEFGIVIGIEKILVWRLPENVAVLHGDVLIDSLASKMRGPKKYDLLVGFTKRAGFSFKHKSPHLGIADTFGRVAIVRLHEKTLEVLLHEMGHIFGASHVETISAMGSHEGLLSREYDPKNKKVIFENRERQF